MIEKAEEIWKCTIEDEFHRRHFEIVEFLIFF